MGGTENAFRRWAREPQFYRDRVFRGTALDIGPGYGPLSRYPEQFPKLTHVTCLDHRVQEEQHGATWVEGKGETCTPLLGQQWDLVYSSHSLEHMPDPSVALAVWWTLVKPGGHLLVMVPEWRMYEKCVWPPHFNTDHRTAWLLHLWADRPLPFMRGLVNECVALPGSMLQRALVLDEGFVPGPDDQTASGTCESSLEVVVQKAA